MDHSPFHERNTPLAGDIEAALAAGRMAFVGGPRQIGKTTLALSLLGKAATERHPACLNWDDPRIRPDLRRGELPPNEPLVVLDEIHKYARWRGLVKGLHDTEKSRRRFIVTGSARLDHYRKGGDSLVGRYRYFRLHPFSLAELGQGDSRADLQALLKFGGLPEPLFAASERGLRLWQRERMTRVIRDDLREDLEVDAKTVERWLIMLENLCVAFRIPPFGARRIRAVRKAQKLYLWDWSTVPEPGPRSENLVAFQLLKYCHRREDVEGHRMELRYLRDTTGREVDFVVMQEGKPQFAVECKTGEKEVAPGERQVLRPAPGRSQQSAGTA